MSNIKQNPRRDSYWRMMKQGRFRAFRNLPVGWVLQILHSTDNSERLFRIIIELSILAAVTSVLEHYFFNGDAWTSLFVGFLFVHTIMWLITGNFWVYMLDSFTWVHNTGLPNNIKYIALVKRVYDRCDCADAVLIYGSMCRSQFHGRSDLDLRVIRRRDSLRGLLALPLGFGLRVYSFFKGIPADFQVVDSLQFLKKQMRDDEYPIVVSLRKGFDIENPGLLFEEVEKNPSIVLREDLRE